MKLLPDDWAAVFQLETALLELVARGSTLYFGLLILLRVMPRRTGGELATMDLIFVVLLAQAAALGLGGYRSPADAMVVIAILIGWNYVVNALSYRVPLVEWLVSSPPLQIIRDGRLLRRNMRREFLTEEELMSHLREMGIDDVKDVKAAYIEGEGKVTAVSRKPGG